jgi:hypothetical protein
VSRKRERRERIIRIWKISKYCSVLTQFSISLQAASFQKKSSNSRAANAVQVIKREKLEKKKKKQFSSSWYSVSNVHGVAEWISILTCSWMSFQILKSNKILEKILSTSVPNTTFKDKEKYGIEIAAKINSVSYEKWTKYESSSCF